MSTLRSAFLLLACLSAAGQCVGQTVRVAGGGGSAGSADGAIVELLQTDSTTSIGIGWSRGPLLSLRRSVTLGGDTMTAGDVTLQLPLPTDLESEPRSFLARGVLLQHGQASGTKVFTGVTGASYTGNYVSTVASTHYIHLVSAQVPVAGATLSLVHSYYNGVRNTLLSISAQRNPFSAYAITVGASNRRAILRASVHQRGNRYRLDANYTAGVLKLQPAIEAQPLSLERIGLNVIASRSLGEHLTVDVARHEYATGSVSSDSLYQGVSASRSQLFEGGATLHVSHAQMYWRRLLSTSATQRGQAGILAASWTSRLWRADATYLRNVNTAVPGGGVPRSVLSNSHGTQIQFSEQVRRRIQAEQTFTFSNSSPPSVSLGGSWDRSRIGLSLTQREAFVPFGNNRGFHPMQLISVRLRLSTGDTGAVMTRGGGMPTSVVATTDNYFAGLGNTGDGEMRQPISGGRMPRFVVHGHVEDAAHKPVRGAAVQVGAQLVYTTSEGEFFARLMRSEPVRVSLVTGQFLTARAYRAVSPAVLTVPEPDGGNNLILQAEICPACAIAMPVDNLEAAPEMAASQPNTIARTAHAMLQLARRMLRLKSAIS